MPSTNQTSAACIQLEDEHSAHNYHPLPVVVARGLGAHVWDPEGNEYVDFLAAYSSVNQGHCHARIVKALCEQASRLCIASRAFHSDMLGAYAKQVTETFGYDMVLPMNTGAEAVETAVKLARKWAYETRRVPDNAAVVLSFDGNFHGRTMTAVSLSTDPTTRDGFGPYLPNVGPHCAATVPYGDAGALEQAMKRFEGRVAAVLVEPIQGEAGVVVPPDGFLSAIQRLCREHNALFIADEIQTGLGRTGTILAVHHEPGVRPDIVLLGKALSGGVYPVSAVLADRSVMLAIRPGEHGSTYGGNPLACAAAMEALAVIRDERLCERSARLGDVFRRQLSDIKDERILAVRGRGLFNALVLRSAADGGVGRERATGRVLTAWDLCLAMRDRGILCKPTHDNIVRLSPPLVIAEEDLAKCVSALRDVLASFDK